MRVKALAGQKKGSLLAGWPTSSPRTAFFWSANVSAAEVTLVITFASFKGAVAAG